MARSKDSAGCIMKPRDPALELATRIYAFREDGETWTDAVDRYARGVLFRHPRTVHRWLSGESPLPAVVADSLRADGRAWAIIDEWHETNEEARP